MNAWGVAAVGGDRAPGLTVADITTLNAAPTAVDADAVVADVRAAARASGHLRILMTDHAGLLGHVVHVRDTMQADVGARATEMARRPSASRRRPRCVYELLRQMHEHRQQLAVVEQGPDLIGVVTLTDVVRRVLPTQEQRSRPVDEGHQASGW